MIKNFFKWIIKNYLKFLTKLILIRRKPLIVAIAGITNKSFVKDIVLKELRENFNVRGNPRTFNSEIGLPLAVLFLPSGYSSIFRWVDVLMTGTYISFFGRKFPQVLVLEIDVKKRGEMPYLLSIFKPDIVAITDVSRVLPDNISQDDLSGDFAKLAESLSKKGTLIINGDDQKARFVAGKAEAQKIFFGTKSDCDVKIENIEKGMSGYKFEIVTSSSREELEIKRFGIHNIYALVEAKIIIDEINQPKLKK